MEQITSSFFTDSCPRDLKRILLRKYDSMFNFYLMKDVNHITYNRKSQAKTSFKDINSLIDDTEYLKRYYCTVSQQRKWQIRDRMTLLKNFYKTAYQLTYEYPMMVVNELSDVFLKRHNKIKKIANQSQSQNQQDESSSFRPKDNDIQYQSKEKQEYIVDLNWSDIIQGKFEEQNQIKLQKPTKKQIQFQEECYIYDNESQVKRQQFKSKLVNIQGTAKSQSKINRHTKEIQVNHLILDFDDLDKENIVLQYNKMFTRQHLKDNQRQNTLMDKKNQPKKIKSLLDHKKPLSSSIIASSSPEDLQPKNNEYEYVNFTKKSSKQSMLIGSREQRQQQMKFMKLSQVEPKIARNFQFPEDILIEQMEGQQSPLYQMINNKNKHPFQKLENNTPQFLCFANNFTNKQYKSARKQSQILNKAQFYSDKVKFNSHNVNSEIKRLRQTPLYQTQTSKWPSPNHPIQQQTKTEFNKLYSNQQDHRPLNKDNQKIRKEPKKMLNRVKSHESLPLPSFQPHQWQLGNIK